MKLLRHYAPLLVLAGVFIVAQIALTHACAVGAFLGVECAYLVRMLESLEVSLVTSAVIYVAFDLFLQTRLVDDFKLALLDPRALEKFISDESLERLGLAVLRRLYGHDNTKDSAEGIWRIVRHLRSVAPRFVTNLSYECAVEEANDQYYRFTVTLSYFRLTFPDGDLVVSCSPLYYPLASHDAALHFDDDAEFSWALLCDRESYELTPGDFQLNSLRIGDAVIFDRATKSESELKALDEPKNGHVRWVFGHSTWSRHASSKDATRDGTLVELQFSVIQARRFGYWSTGCRYPCKRFSAQIDYNACPSIEDASVVTHFASEAKSRVISPTRRRLKVICDGWVLPYSGAVFSWTEMPKQGASPLRARSPDESGEQPEGDSLTSQ